jgi:hypothetical protein
LTAAAARAQPARMGTVVVKIWSVSWRDGRPRFNPGPKLRRLKYKGEDLRHGANGPWFTLDETIAWAAARRAEAGQRREQKAAGLRLAPLRRPGVASVREVFDRWFDECPKFNGGVARGKRVQKGLAAVTVSDYRNKADVLCAFDPELAACAAAALTPELAQAVFEKLWEDRGLSMARGIVAVGSSCWGWAKKQPGLGVKANPWGDVEKPMAEPRLRVGEPFEILALVAANDAIGQPWMGDSIMLGVWTGQRQGDRRTLQLAGRDDRNRIKLRQSKTGAIVQIPGSPQLEARLAAAAARRKAADVASTFLLVNEDTGRALKKKPYNDAWRAGRDAAVHGVIRIEGCAVVASEANLGYVPDPANSNLEWLVKPCPSLAGFNDQDLRDTAVTWLARASATLAEICAITGHSEASATAVMKHYLAKHPEMADSAIAKLVVWAEKQGMGA